MANWEQLSALGFSVKDEIDRIESLESYLRNPSLERVRFAVEVIADIAESWIVRAETCRFIRDIEFEKWSETDLCAVIYKILQSNNEEISLQQWVAFNLPTPQNEA